MPSAFAESTVAASVESESDVGAVSLFEQDDNTKVTAKHKQSSKLIIEIFLRVFSSIFS